MREALKGGLREEENMPRWRIKMSKSKLTDGAFLFLLQECINFMHDAAIAHTIEETAIE